MKPLTPSHVAALRRGLLRWYPGARRELPWRFPAGEGDPYRVWISEAMLQQTQVATVVPYYRRFLERFPSLEALAAASEEEVLAAWAGLGYYARGRALLRAAREAVARHGGLPASLEALRELPGFGPYTAGAVASIAFGLPTPAVDGNVARVLSRLFLVSDDPTSSRFRRRIWALAEALHAPGARVGVASTRRGEPRAGRPTKPRGRGARPGPHPGDLNQALIELGALLCRPGAPACERCPVASLCVARGAGKARSLPRARRRAPSLRLRVAVLVLTCGGKVLLVRRPASGLFAGMWGPPTVELEGGTGGTGGTSAAGAGISAAIEREPFGITGGIVFVGAVERQLTHRKLELLVHAGRLASAPRRSARWRLVPVGALGDQAIPAALRMALDAGLGAGPEGRAISREVVAGRSRRRPGPRQAQGP